MIVPFNNPDLLTDTSTAAQSPVRLLLLLLLFLQSNVAGYPCGQYGTQYVIAIRLAGYVHFNFTVF